MSKSISSTKFGTMFYSRQDVARMVRAKNESMLKYSLINSFYSSIISHYYLYLYSDTRNSKENQPERRSTISLAIVGMEFVSILLPSC